jgi:MSHA biogenesis protein MshK
MTSRLATLVAACLLAQSVFGAPFTDPTRPPSASDDGMAAGAEAGPRVESILIAPDRRIAIISGETVTLGSRIAAGEVVRINETEVVVWSAQGERRLRLYPQLIGRESPTEKGTAK